MITINDIVEYVTETPENINVAILRQFLNELANEEPPIPVEDIDDFIAAIEKGGNIQLNNDLVLPDNLVIDKNVNLILNGKTLDCGTKQLQINDGGNLTLEGQGTIVGSNRPIGVRDGNLVINGATITSTNDTAVDVSGENASVTFNKGLITAQEVGILGTYKAHITMNGGTVKTTDNFCIGGNGTPGRGGTVITINGGKLEGHITSAGYVACGVYHPQDGVLNITGGEITGINGCGVLMRAGVLNMSGGIITGTGESGTKGKVGDSKVTVGPNGVIYDQSAHYPDNQNLALNIIGGTIKGIDASVDVLKDEDHDPNITIKNATLIPPIEDEIVIYDGGDVGGYNSENN